MLLYSSGGYVFEWRDEWWKLNPHPCFHSISGDQDCGRLWQGCPADCGNTGAANVVFPGGWGDEEWFGVTGAKARGPGLLWRHKSKHRQAERRPQILIPRAPAVALYELFNAP